MIRTSYAVDRQSRDVGVLETSTSRVRDRSPPQCIAKEHDARLAACPSSVFMSNSQSVTAAPPQMTFMFHNM
jgi:hypothetical protein